MQSNEHIRFGGPHCWKHLSTCETNCLLRHFDSKAKQINWTFRNAVPILWISKLEPFFNDVQKISRFASMNTIYWSFMAPARVTATCCTVVFVWHVVTSFCRDAPGIKSNTWITKRNLLRFVCTSSEKFKLTYGSRLHNPEQPWNVIPARVFSRLIKPIVKLSPKISVSSANDPNR